MLFRPALDSGDSSEPRSGDWMTSPSFPPPCDGIVPSIPTAVPPPVAPRRVHGDTSRPIVLAVAFYELWMLDVRVQFCGSKRSPSAAPRRPRTRNTR